MKKTNSSMQLTRAADYGVRAMIYLIAAGAESRLSLGDLAAATNAPVSFLSKVLQTLSSAGLISSRRGQSGGFRISTRGRAASMLEVIEAIDGKISLNVCLLQGKSCGRKTFCPAHPIWIDAQRAMLQVLGHAKIAALAAGPLPLKPVCPLQLEPASPSPLDANACEIPEICALCQTAHSL